MVTLPIWTCTWTCLIFSFYQNKETEKLIIELIVLFIKKNIGVWFMHCHLDRHMIWGMDTVFITKNGNSTDAKILPPPADKPRC